MTASSGSVVLAGAEADRDDQPQPEHEREHGHRQPQRALRDPRVHARAEHRARHAAGHEDRARLGIERAARRHRVGHRRHRGDRQDRQQRRARRGVAVEARGPDQAGDDDDPAADAEQARRAAPRRLPRPPAGGYTALARASSSSATLRSCGVVTLKFSGATRPPARCRRRARRARRRRWRGRASPRRRRARARARRGGTPAASGSPTGASGPAWATTARSSPASLIVSGTRRGDDRRVGAGQRRERVGELVRPTSGRAASWTTTSSARGAASSAGAHRLRARRPAGHAEAARRRGLARRQRDHDLLDPRRPQRGDAPLQHRATGENDERLGSIGAKAFAAARGHQEGDRHVSESPD